jgi:hypothetical protein
MSADDRDVDRWRSAWRDASAESDPTSCAASELIWGAVQGELDAEEAALLLNHAAACGRCQDAWRAARELAAPASDSTGSRTEIRAAFPRYLFPLAAIFVVTVLAIGYRQLTLRSELPANRAAPLASIEPLLAEGERLDRTDARLRWSAGPPGTRYRLVIANERGGWSKTIPDLKDSSYRIAAADLARLEPEEVLLWRVTATHPDGTEISSITFRHRLGP